ncbi:hypothetical protein HYH03_014948 [Edaphochlamys debaryana]|uniref:Protein kinase domain-containing protein n=1 Tax=Edaphochlamys debaryana TaxID=47281 RepID=A0A835XN33_9CHLO|nr:hypothetical protein HYH03_014948 [Edaphochlamys debaryana]|eukprot:KAG2486367.1 hypothetical protein HYH03_014948 [Edaphochlamys debaryana]
MAAFSGASVCSFLADSGSLPSGEPRLTVLASSGGASHAVPAGLQLPGLAAAGDETRRPPAGSWDQVPLALPLMGPRSSKPAMGSGAVAAALRTEAGVPLPQAPLPLPPCWFRLLQRIQAVTGGRPPSAAVLVPLLLGSRRVGAMLLVLPPSGPKLKQPQPQLRLSAPGALEALGACVAECCLGPVLPAVEQAAAATAAVSSAASLSELTSALTSALSAALSAQLHVDLTVRLAVLPYKEARAGVLFSTASAACKTGAEAQPPSPSDRAVPRPSAATSQTGRARAVQSSRALGGVPSSPSTWLIHNTSQACLRGTTPFSRHSHTDASAVSGPAAAVAEACGGFAVRSGAASSGLPMASPAAALKPDCVSCTGSVALDSLLSTGRHATPLRPCSPELRADSCTSMQHTAWKACPFTSAATLLAALLSGLAGAEHTSPCASRLSPAACSRGEAETAVELRAPMELRAQVVADVPAFLHDPERPSKDLFSLARRAGGAGGVASLLAISAVWAAPAGLLLSRGAAEGGPGAPAERGGGAELPALGLYVYSALPLPQSLLAAAQGHAAGLLKVLAPGVMRALASGGPVADQWAVLRGQALGATAAHLPSSSRLFSDGASRGGDGSTALSIGNLGGSTHVLASAHALLHDSRAITVQTLAPAPVAATLRAPVDSMGRPSPELPPVLRLSAGSGTAPPLALASKEVPTACGVSWGGSGRIGAFGRELASSCSLSAAGAASAELALPSSGGLTALGLGEASRVKPARAAPFSRLSHNSAAPPLPTTHRLYLSATTAGAPAARQPLLSFLSVSTRKSPNGHGAAAGAAVPSIGAELGASGGAAAADDLTRYAAAAAEEAAAAAAEAAHWELEAETLAMLTGTASDLSAVANQHQQLTTLVNAFTTTLARSRTAADMHASAHAEADMRALSITHAIGQGACSVVMQGSLHAMSVAVKVILVEQPTASICWCGSEPLDDDDEDGNAGPWYAGPDLADQQSPTAAHLPWVHPVAAGSTSSGDLAKSKEGKGARAATLRRRKRLQALVRSARELAVLTSISHPNIVQVYSYCTRVVVEEPQPGRPRLRVVPEGEEAEVPFSTALIMECCDMGSLADAIDSGLFYQAARRAAAVARAQRPATGGHPSHVAQAAAMSTAGTPALRAAYLTLLEVALALRHLHSLNLVHCDVKPANVLLRSSATDPRGFTAKLTDFGFVSLVPSPSTEREGGAVQGPQEPAGTVTHMAPELFVSGTVPDSSIDCYAFGILMWEIFTGRAPYADCTASDNFAEVPAKVAKEGLRPRFPPDTPLLFKQLARDCWSAAPSQRPTAAALVTRLQALMDASSGGGGGGGAE